VAIASTTRPARKNKVAPRKVRHAYRPAYLPLGGQAGLTSEHGTGNPEPELRNLEPGTGNPEHGLWTKNSSITCGQIVSLSAANRYAD